MKKHAFNGLRIWDTFLLSFFCSQYLITPPILTPLWILTRHRQQNILIDVTVKTVKKWLNIYWRRVSDIIRTEVSLAYSVSLADKLYGVVSNLRFTTALFKKKKKNTHADWYLKAYTEETEKKNILLRQSVFNGLIETRWHLKITWYWRPLGILRRNNPSHGVVLIERRWGHVCKS